MLSSKKYNCFTIGGPQTAPADPAATPAAAPAAAPAADPAAATVPLDYGKEGEGDPSQAKWKDWWSGFLKKFYIF